MHPRILSLRVPLALAMLTAACAGPAQSDSPSATAAQGSNGAAPSASAEEPAEVAGTLRVVTNFGSAFYSLILGVDLLAEEYPDVEVEHVTLTSGADGLTAVAAGQADVVTVGAPPLLVAREQGLEVKLAGNLTTADLGLVAMNDAYQTLEDFGPEDSIATPSLTAIGTIALLAAAKRELGDFSTIQDALRPMPHPDAVAALENGQIAAHMATPPFVQNELAAGGHEIVGGNDFLGTEFPFSAYAVSEAFYEQNRPLYDALVANVQEATDMINDDPEEAARRLAANENVVASGATEEEILDQITEEGRLHFTTEFVGYDDLAAITQELGMIESAPPLSEVSFENVTGNR